MGDDRAAAVAGVLPAGGGPLLGHGAAAFFHFEMEVASASAAAARVSQGAMMSGGKEGRGDAAATYPLNGRPANKKNTVYCRHASATAAAALEEEEQGPE